MRIGKIVPSMHGEEGDTMLQWFLPGPFFEVRSVHVLAALRCPRRRPIPFHHVARP